jgi:hypothetical protein
MLRGKNKRAPTAVMFYSNATGISRTVTSLVFRNQLHHSRYVHNYPRRVGSTGAITTLYVGSDILEFSAPFSDKCTLTTPSSYTDLRISSDFRWREHIGPYIPNTTTNFFAGSRFQCHCQCTAPNPTNIISMTNAPYFTIIATTSATFYRIICFRSTEDTPYGTLLHATYCLQLSALGAGSRPPDTANTV